MDYYMNHHPVPKSMPKQERESLLSELKQLRRIASMDGATFAGVATISTMWPDLADPTDYIKEITRLYRQTWLIDPLDQLIARYDFDAFERLLRKPNIEVD